MGEDDDLAEFEALLRRDAKSNFHPSEFNPHRVCPHTEIEIGEHLDGHEESGRYLVFCTSCGGSFDGEEAVRLLEKHERMMLKAADAASKSAALLATFVKGGK